MNVCGVVVVISFEDFLVWCGQVGKEGGFFLMMVEFFFVCDCWFCYDWMWFIDYYVY